MSGTHKERSRTGEDGRRGGCGSGKSGGDDEEEGGGGSTGAEASDDKVDQRCFPKVKRVSLFRFRKAGHRSNHRRKRRGNIVTSQCGAGRGVPAAGGGGLFLCMRQPMTMGSSGESPTSDPNSPEFTDEMLRGLIQKNDFWSKDCNTHFIDADVDIDSLSPSSLKNQ